MVVRDPSELVAPTSINRADGRAAEVSRQIKLSMCALGQAASKVWWNR